MKLLVSINKLEQLSLNADAFVLGYEKFSSFAPALFSYAQIKEACMKKSVFVLMNSLINEDELKIAIKEIDRLKELGVGFIVQDIGLLHHLIKTYDKTKVIFNPYTLICNVEDLKEYQNDDITVFVSDVATDKKELLGDKTALFVYGYLPIYQSFRKVLSLYENGHDISLSEKDLFIKENTRDDLHHIIENEFGTVIFDSKVCDEIKIENLKADYWYIDSSYLLDKEVETAIKRVRDLCAK